MNKIEYMHKGGYRLEGCSPFIMRDIPSIGNERRDTVWER